MVRFSDMLGGNGDPEGRRAPTAPAPEPDIAPPPEAEDGPDIDDTDESDDSELPPDAPDADGVHDAHGTDDAEAIHQTPEDVLDRLTQYASSTRAADPVPPPPAPAPDTSSAPDELAPVGDDLLPRPKGETKKRRRK